MRNFAHRGLWRQPAEQNTLAAIEAAFEAGLDAETDVRFYNSEFVIKHNDLGKDEVLPGLDGVVELIKRYPEREAALHFKYDDWKDEKSLGITEVLQPVKDQVFLFDMSLDYCRQVKEKDPRIKVGVSVGDNHYHDAFAGLEEALASDVDIIWADEWRSLYTRGLVEACHGAGKLIYCISPDLATAVGHPRALVGYDKTWRDLFSWGVDGVCTDHGLELQRVYVLCLRPIN